MRFVFCSMKQILFAATLLIAHCGFSQHVLELLEEQHPAAGKVEDFSWMAGSWSCAIWDGVAEEYWMVPQSNSMAGMFRFSADDSLRFLEIFTLEQSGRSVTLKLKHFDAGLQGWEEQDDCVSFVLVYQEPNRAYFDGMTYILRDPDHLDVFVLMDHGDGTQEELHFPYFRISR